MKKFWIRTASSVVYVALFLGTMLSGVILNNELAGTLIFLAFLLFVACGCTFEFYRIAKMKGANPIEWLGYVVACLTIITFPYLDIVDISKGGTFDFLTVLGFVGVFVCFLLAMPLAAIIQLWRKSDSPFGDIGYTFLSVFYIALPLGLMLFLHSYNPYVLMLVVALLWINDACAYMLGSMIGKHKMWPKHSPGKTWEGTVAGVAIATAIGACIVRFWPNVFGNMETWQGAMLGFVCGAIGTMGDLVESMLKRSVGLKDSGKILPGHGGFLDRFDSLLILMPFATIFIVLFTM
ncbi:MAG: phosphatidate cytidylyltransferase [Bacteroidales bacterium]|nr:phosphatidate cytidylyltransferase [Bacteroidales bacterium]